LPPLPVLVLLLADAWPPILLLLWRMLCRPAALSCGCFAAPCSSGCLAAVIVKLFGRLRRMLCRRGCAALWLTPTDALPPCCFVVRMLCRSLLQRMLGRYDCDALWSSPADALPLWLRCSLVDSDGCFTVMRGLLGGCLATLLCGLSRSSHLVVSSLE
jgi:hypothetical protein